MGVTIDPGGNATSIAGDGDTAEPVVESLWVPADKFQRVSGSNSTYTHYNRWGVLSFPDNFTEVWAATIILPDHWSTMAVDVLWVNIGTASGNCGWRHDRAEGGVGDSAATPTSGTLTPTAAAAQGIVTQTTLAAAHSVTAGKWQTVTIDRLGADALDTLTSAAGALGLLLRKTA